jgi:hypothetical protein
VLLRPRPSNRIEQKLNQTRNHRPSNLIASVRVRGSHDRQQAHLNIQVVLNLDLHSWSSFLSSTYRLLFSCSKGPVDAQEPRESPRQSTTPSSCHSPASDPDELLVNSTLLFFPLFTRTCITSILVYPLSGTGAVNINKSDLNRLQPGEFLNDTLIEFGLK